MKLQVLLRKIHRWGSIIIAASFLVVIVSGIFLLLKKQVGWIQPPTARGASVTPRLSFEQIYEIARTVPEAEIHSWADIERLDLRPRDGSIKVQARNRWEIQIDTETGAILQTAYRRSDLIESIHDGSWFHERVKLWIFLPSAIIVLTLWLTGIYLFFLPYKARWSRRRKRTPSASGHETATTQNEQARVRRTPAPDMR